jgi:hypothetical protein
MFQVVTDALADEWERNGCYDSRSRDGLDNQQQQHQHDDHHPYHDLCWPSEEATLAVAQVLPRSRFARLYRPSGTDNNTDNDDDSNRSESWSGFGQMQYTK